jgi:hypothetical protein
MYVCRKVWNPTRFWIFTAFTGVVHLRLVRAYAMQGDLTAV